MTGLVAVLVAFWTGWFQALAVIVGGLVGMAGTAFFSRRLFQAAPGSTARQMLRAFQWGAFGKMALTVALFAVAIVGLEMPVLPLLGGYVATLIGYWSALPFVTDETTGK
jgi:F0F1-type ATP synthase assembly protein I